MKESLQQALADVVFNLVSLMLQFRNFIGQIFDDLKFSFLGGRNYFRHLVDTFVDLIHMLLDLAKRRSAKEISNSTHICSRRWLVEMEAQTIVLRNLHKQWRIQFLVRFIKFWNPQI